MLVDLKKVFDIIQKLSNSSDDTELVIQHLKDKFTDGEDLPDRSHIKLEQSTGRALLKCEHCAATYDYEKHLPLSINMSTALMNGFASDHEYCIKRV